MKAEEMKQEFVMKYRLIAFDKDGKRRCNEEEMLVGIDKICDAVIAERSPSNEQIHEAALAWARDHGEAPDKDCPEWLIRDYEAGAYFVRQCYGCWNKTEKMVSERDDDIFDKMNCLIGYLERWLNNPQSNNPPAELRSVIDEAIEYLKSREK